MTSPAKLPFHKLFPLIHASYASQSINAADRDSLYAVVRCLIQNARQLRVTCVDDIHEIEHARTRQILHRHMLFPTYDTVDKALQQLYDLVGIEVNDAEPEEDTEAETDGTETDGTETDGTETDGTEDTEDADDTDEDTDEDSEDPLMEVCLETLATVQAMRAMQDRQTRHMGWMVGMLVLSVAMGVLALGKCRVLNPVLP